MSEATYLDKILAAKRSHLANHPMENLAAGELNARISALPPARDFFGALRATGPTPKVIAEFKRASPSEGTIRENANPTEIAQLYAEAGASAISVLTDEHFSGSFEDLRAVKRAVNLPVLCKDFMLSRGQIIQARLEGADAILLIVAALEPPLLRELLQFAEALGLGVLCEAHDANEVERAMAAGARTVGVNSRDLRTFEVDLDRTIALRSMVPQTFTYVAESGIRSRQDVERLRQAGVDAILVGTHLMRAEDPGGALDDLIAQP